jgi:rubrerythrin
MSRGLHSPELHAIEIDGMTRSSFLLRGALAAGAMYGAGAVGPYVTRALAQSGGGDIAIVNFALGLEQLEAAFLEFALKNAKLSGPVKQLATLFAEQEAEHAATLKQAVTLLGAKPAPAPKVKFDVSDEKTFLAVGIQLEEAGIGAYNGAAPRLRSPDLVSAAGGIVQVEARHAASLRMQAGQDPAPAAFDAPLSPAKVEAAVKQALKG